MLNFGIIIVLVLLSALATVVASFARPRFTHVSALGGMVVICLAWLAARVSLPLTLTLGLESSLWPAWSWRAGSVSWTISLAIILLSLGVLALAARSDQHQRTDTLFIHLLASAALLACWSDSLATHVMTWSAMAIVWVLDAAAAMDDGQPWLPALSRRAAAAFTGVLVLWFAAISAGPGADISGIEAWPTLTRTLVLVAAAYQIGLFSFHAWESNAGERSAVRLALLHAAPAAAGAVLLARLEASSQIGLAFALPFTLVGLLALLAGAYRAWIALPHQTALAVGLIQSQSGLVLLAGVWVGPEAVVVESLVLLLAGGILLLDIWRERLAGLAQLPQPGVIISAAALAALPLTAGFAGRSALYATWLEESRWLLMVVTALLHIPLLTALFTAYLPPGRRLDNAPGEEHPTPDVARTLSLLLPTLALFSVSALSQAPAVAWLAILLPVLVAGLVAWRLEEPAELSRTVRQAMALPIAAERPSFAGLRRVATAATAAARDALSLLEGEGGLLWLLLFVVILYFI